MRIKIRTAMLAVVGALAMNTSAQAVTLSGGGCNITGPVTYVYANSGSSMAIVGGLSCFITGITAAEMSAFTAIASESRTSGRSITIGTGASQGGGTATGLSMILR